MDEVTAGIDIGTTSVKAVVADGEGAVLSRIRIPHRVVSTDPGRFEYDPQAAWIDGVMGAWDEVAAVTVSAMVPSMCGVDSAGRPITPGLPVDVPAEPDSAAHGAAYHSRVIAGLEDDISQARRWGRVSHRVEPRAGHSAAAEGRYRRFREGADR